MNRDFNVKLFAARMEKMWTVENAAEAIGVDKQTYRRWELGKQKPHLSCLRLLCKAFDKKATELGF